MPPSPEALAFLTVPVMWPAVASLASMPEVVSPAITTTSLAAASVGWLS